MKKTLIFSLAIAILGSLLTACNDDMGISNHSEDGSIYMKFLFNDPTAQWNDDGTPRRQTRLHQPLTLQNPEGIEQPFYLHCEEMNDIEMPDEQHAVTRGERITGEAFDERNKVKNFGLYVSVGGENVLPISTEIQRSELTEEGEWWVKEQDLTFEGDGGWESGKTGDFYGFAPFPGYDDDDPTGEDYEAGHARCITVDDAAAAPTVTFTMQPEERKNKDILTARKTGVTSDEKNAGVELQFHHVLSALKFKVEDDSGFLTYTVGVPPEQKDYEVHITGLTVRGIYREGTAEIGNEYTDEGSTRTSHWTYETTDENLGNCTADISKLRTDIDTDKQINTDDNCLMVLPQTVPTGAKLVVTADLVDAATATTFMQDVTFEVNLAGLTWLPGYTYTYKLSKDPRTYSYTLDSEYDGITGNSFSFTCEGGSQDFNVTSYLQKLEDGSVTTSPVAWHVEFSEDGGSSWTAGMPVGFTLTEKTTGEHMDANSDIPGSTTAVAYTLTAPMRIDESEGITTLVSNDYSLYAGGDGYYDLSTHAIGLNAETSVRNTANCYIVNGYGKFKFPLVYGNAIKQGIDNPIAYRYNWDDDGHGVFLNYKGNYINNAYINADCEEYAADAIVVWQDESNVVRSESVQLVTDYSTDISGTSFYRQYLCFEILQGDARPANIVLAARNASGTIMWSWHIWVTAYDDFHETTELAKTVDGTTYRMKVAHRNIGWRAPEVHHYNTARNFIFRVVQNDLMGKEVQHPATQNAGLVALGGSNITYQNGRKDPFPNISVYVENYTNDASGKVNTVTYAQRDLFDLMGISITTNRLSVSESIKHPKTYYNTASNWFLQTYLDSPANLKTVETQQRYRCWDPSGSDYNAVQGIDFNMDLPINYRKNTKTIYDPSPVGFRVPTSGFCGMLENLTYTYHDNYPEQIDGKSISAPIPYITDNTYGLTFYLAGCRRRRYQSSDGATGFGLADFRTYGYIWTAGMYGNGTTGTYLLTKNASAVKVGTGARDVCQGFAVRPIVDDIEEVEAYAGAPTKNFKQGDAMNVELTKKSEGNDLVWGISNLGNISLDFGGTTKTIQSIVDNNTTYSNKRVYIKNIRVYFEYSGRTYGIAIKRIANGFSITYGSETKGGYAFDLVSTIPDHYQFSAHWARKNLADITDWTDLVELTKQRVNITRVVADLRLTYVEED